MLANIESANFVGNRYLSKLLASQALCYISWQSLHPRIQEQIQSQHSLDELLQELANHQLLSPYQVERLQVEPPANMMAGNYRILRPLGTGASRVFEAEHCFTQQTVAVKIIPIHDPAPKGLQSFFQIVRALKELRSNHHVTIIDAAFIPENEPWKIPRVYIVQEFFPGQSFQEYIQSRGGFSVADACLLIHQLARILEELTPISMTHRLLCPSSLLLNRDGKPKLTNFGLLSLGQLPQDSVNYIAPEVSIDIYNTVHHPNSDIYSLAMLLIHAMTGVSLGKGITADHRREVLENLPAPVMNLINRMTADKPSDRPSASAVAHELTPFLPKNRQLRSLKDSDVAPPQNVEKPLHPILIVDDEPAIRDLCKQMLKNLSSQIDELDNGQDAVRHLRKRAYDLLILDMELPGMSGIEVIQQLQFLRANPHMKVLMLSGNARADVLSSTLFVGADDFLTKPFTITQLQARVSSLLRLKDAQAHLDSLTKELAKVNMMQEMTLNARDSELRHALGALVMAMALTVEQKSRETGAHLLRLQQYSRQLGNAAIQTLAFRDRLSPDLIQAIEAAAPLHDIGKVAVPDHILNKPDKLTPEERAIMQQHANCGADTLANVTQRYPFASGFFHVAIEIARHHHERWDGNGYPDRLAGEAIPLSARIVAIADVYDALRSPRVYKLGLSHEQTVQKMLQNSPGHFDPNLLRIFAEIAPDFEAIFANHVD